jgi:xanthine phosphoribosyltransferase
MTETDPKSTDRIVTWDDVHRDTRALVNRLTSYGPWTGIVAIARGGLVPAAIIGREMNIRRMDTLCITTYDDRTKGSANILKTPETAVAVKGSEWLVVDDLADTGETLRAARTILPEAYFATIYVKPEGLSLVDTFVHQVPQTTWIVFPWDLPPG